MISAPELLLIKSRLMQGADAARKIATSTDPVFYDQEQYEAVFTALTSMSQDLSRILAELDVLRGMFYSGVSLFLSSEMNHGNGMPNAGRDVVGVPEQANSGSGEGEPPVSQGADGGVPSSGPVRKRTKRSQPRRNTKGDAEISVAVGPGDGSGEVDSGKDG